MSPEVLLLLFIFVLLPLIERLLRGLREPGEPEPPAGPLPRAPERDRGRPAPRAPAPQPPAPLRRPAPPAGPPRPAAIMRERTGTAREVAAAIRPAGPDRRSARSLPRRDAERAAPPVRAPRARRRDAIARSVHNRRDLRRAVVLMTILGPCRAMSPPERAGAAVQVG